MLKVSGRIARSAIVLIVFIFAISLVPACEPQPPATEDDEPIGGQKDKDDIDPMCTDTCYNLLECGGSSWFLNEDECLFWCDDWLLAHQECADCLVGCWYVEDSSDIGTASDDDDDNDNDDATPEPVDCDEAIKCMGDCALSVCY